MRDREILVIEDEPVYRRSIIRLFRGKPYTFIEAASPKEGIAMLSSNPQVQVILLDLSFGVASGKEFLEHIKKQSDDYRVIILTAHEKRLRAERAGAYDVFTYLAKAEHSGEAVRFSVEQAFKDLERAHLDRKLARLLEIQRRINSRANLKDTLDLLCRSVLEMVGGYTCHIRLYDFSKGDYHTAGFAGDSSLCKLFATPRAKGEIFSGRVVQSGKAERIDNLQKDAAFRAFAADALTREDVSEEERDYWHSVESAYLVPITTGVFGDQVDAVINLNSTELSFFDKTKCDQVDEFVTQATLAITKDWLQTKREAVHSDYSEIARMLNDITDALKGPEVLNSIYKVVIGKIAEIVNPEIVSIFLYDESTGLLDNVAERRGDEPMKNIEEAYRPGESFTGKVFRDNETLLLPDAKNPIPEEDPRFDPQNLDKYLLNIPSKTVKHYIGVPIRIGDTVRGVLRAVNKRSEYYNLATAHNPRCLLDRGFSGDCRNALEIAARYLAVAIQNAELLREKDRQFEQIRMLAEVSRIINSALDRDEVLKLTISKMAEVMQAEICMLFLKDASGESIVLEQTFGLPDGMLASAFYDLGEGVTGWVAKTGEPKLIKKAVQNTGKYDSRIVEYLTSKHGEPRAIDSLMVVPIQAGENILGAMKVINKGIDDPLQYTEDDLKFFQTFADYVEVAIFNAEVYKDATERLAIAERNAALSQLVRAVAHEINNTFGTISATLDSVRARLGSPEPDIERMLSRIDEAATQTTEFANEIGGFSAGRAGIKEPCNVNEVTKNAVSAIDFRRYDNWDFISVDEAYSPLPLVCDIHANPFSQAIRNIVINAFQAMADKPGGKLWITTEEGTGDYQGKAILRFRDNGPGIREEHRHRIFEPDFTTKPSGNGVGLWLVQSQLQLIGGTIDVDSVFGEGATFTLTVPLSKHGEQAS